MPNKIKRPKVYALTRQSYDYSQAEQFGDLIFVATTTLPKYDMRLQKTIISNGLKDITEDDYIILSGLPTYMSLAMFFVAKRLKKVKVLLWRYSEYISVEISDF